MALLSGEHPTLPQAEIRGAVKGEGGALEVMEELDQVMIFETDVNPSRLASRLAMSREICLHLCTSNWNEVLEAVASSDLPDLLPADKSFAVRVVRIKDYCPEVKTLDLERQIADVVLDEFDLKIDLESPETELVVALTEGKCCVGLKIAETQRKLLSSRRPTTRAAFHPSTLSPILARCMVNLARTPKGGKFCDPFCGVGGILIEAGLVGAFPIGFDIDPKMIEGARRNLEQAGIREYQLEVRDARELAGLEVDAIATDPPYGIQSSTWGDELLELYTEALASIASILKRKAVACLGAPSSLNLEKTIEASGLVPIEFHEQYVHKTLSRRIYVLRKR